jgi:hypothetical protein
MLYLVAYCNSIAIFLRYKIAFISTKKLAYKTEYQANSKPKTGFVWWHY